MTDRSKIVDYYLQRIMVNDFEFSQVRNDLEKNGFNEEEIRVMVRIVDSELQIKLLIIANNKKANDLVYIGAILTLVGVIKTAGTYTGLINMGNSFLIVYGPFLGGLSTLLVGLAKKRQA